MISLPIGSTSNVENDFVFSPLVGVKTHGKGDKRSCEAPQHQSSFRPLVIQKYVPGLGGVEIGRVKMGNKILHKIGKGGERVEQGGNVHPGGQKHGVNISRIPDEGVEVSDSF